MELNFECVRACIMAVEAQQKLDSHGTPKPLKVRDLYGSELLKGIPHDEIHLALTYLVEKKLLKLGPGQSLSGLAPARFVLHGISAQGYDYLAAVRDNTLWKKILKALGKVGLASVPTVIETAAKFAAGSLLPPGSPNTPP